ncbi:pyridoxamine 5'-phosphate oxidase family protein [Labrys neptuniae]|uniref:pyridoxamine 5'-phosphate oxidase family protein n=1 Tax=Labrys neptuniae TaxID=376174 RepID=UPI00288CA7AD|nr:pyridoxamine 5'-phosphate oxidase family protein [Labrys neptuniae]MDT3379913.1 pyridoxamine 5'-phosphate oxidase family protein [Labrys neptuniae]
MLDAAARAVIERHSLGYVASVNPDGTPNLSPKGMMPSVLRFEASPRIAKTRRAKE